MKKKKWYQKPIVYIAAAIVVLGFVFRKKIMGLIKPAPKTN